MYRSTIKTLKKGVEYRNSPENIQDTKLVVTAQDYMKAKTTRKNPQKRD